MGINNDWIFKFTLDYITKKNNVKLTCQYDFRSHSDCYDYSENHLTNKDLKCMFSPNSESKKNFEMMMYRIYLTNLKFLNLEAVYQLCEKQYIDLENWVKNSTDYLMKIIDDSIEYHFSAELAKRVSALVDTFKPYNAYRMQFVDIYYYFILYLSTKIDAPLFVPIDIHDFYYYKTCETKFLVVQAGCSTTTHNYSYPRNYYSLFKDLNMPVWAYRD